MMATVRSDDLAIDTFVAVTTPFPHFALAHQPNSVAFGFVLWC